MKNAFMFSAFLIWPCADAIGPLVKQIPTVFPEDIEIMIRAENSGDSSVCIPLDERIGLFQHCVENVVRATKTSKACLVYELKEHYKYKYDYKRCNKLAVYLNDPMKFCREKGGRETLDRCISKWKRLEGKFMPDVLPWTRFELAQETTRIENERIKAKEEKKRVAALEAEKKRIEAERRRKTLKERIPEVFSIPKPTATSEKFYYMIRSPSGQYCPMPDNGEEMKLGDCVESIDKMKNVKVRN